MMQDVFRTSDAQHHVLVETLIELSAELLFRGPEEVEVWVWERVRRHLGNRANPQT